MSLPSLSSVLKNVFGFDEFRGHQKQIIQSLLSGSDCLVLMPTGGGKSLCYQVPALLLEGLTIVISPLIALMKDQVDALRQNGVNADFLNHSQDRQSQLEVVNRLKSGETKLLYLAPERLLSGNSKMLDFLKSLKIDLFAIDEAHCISHWGHDFRPDYLALSGIKQNFPNTPIVALTATADRLTRKDILEKLKLNHPKQFISSFDRPNIRYLIRPKRNEFDELLQIIHKNRDESGIIYCLSRNATEQWVEKLRINNIEALPYHAGLSKELREKNQELFQKDKVRIIVATIAFGMGIDKSNVRYIVHMDLPKNIESYYQETGRAGRDGLPSEATLFYSYSDVSKLRSFLDAIEDEQQKEIMIQKLKKLTNFCQVKTCRRQFLLKYFDEESKSYCGNCDVCLSKYEQINAGIPAQMVLSAVIRLNQMFGEGYIIDFLRGSKSQKIKEPHKKMKTYGVAQNYSREELETVIRELLEQDYLEKTRGMYPTLLLTEKSAELLKPNTPFYIKKVKESVVSGVYEASSADQELFQLLRKLRNQIADSEGVPPYIILSDASLKELARFKPRDKDVLQNITGFGSVKVSKYGSAFLHEIIQYCDQHGLKSIPIVGKEVKPLVPKKGETSQISYSMFKKGNSIEQIAELRNLSKTTIANHLVAYIYSGEIKISELVNDEKTKLIESALKKAGTSQLRPIFEACPPNSVSYEDIRMVIAAQNLRP
jgi:ATP-dependent DNA helicase RecQ